MVQSASGATRLVWRSGWHLPHGLLPAAVGACTVQLAVKSEDSLLRRTSLTVVRIGGEQIFWEVCVSGLVRGGQRQDQPSSCTRLSIPNRQGKAVSSAPLLIYTKLNCYF